MSLVYFISAFIITAVLVPVVCFLARRFGFVDKPGGRKQHEGAVPPVGGLVIFPVFIALSLHAHLSSQVFWLGIAVVSLLVVGVVDDFRHLSARFKFLMQIVAACMIVLPGQTVIYYLGNLLGFGEMGLAWFGPVFSIVAVVLFINAINLMDGLDGLAGGQAMIVFLALLYMALGAGAMIYAVLLMVMVGCLAGFLVYNMRAPWRKRASVFLGDSGSLAIGLALAWFCIGLSQYPYVAVRPVCVAWLLAIPVFDICGQFARRIRLGQHPFEADHHHFHHHFLFAGLRPGQATAFILLLAAMFAVIGLGGIAIGVPEYILAYVWTALLLGHIFMSMRPHRYRRIVSRVLKRFGGAPQQESEG